MAEHIVHLASAATQITPRPADAAALLMDAAAMLSVEAKMPAEEAIQRFAESYQTLAAALEVVNAHRGDSNRTN